MGYNKIGVKLELAEGENQFYFTDLNNNRIDDGDWRLVKIAKDRESKGYFAFRSPQNDLITIIGALMSITPTEDNKYKLHIYAEDERANNGVAEYTRIYDDLGLVLEQEALGRDFDPDHDVY